MSATAYAKAGVDIVKADRFTSILSKLVPQTFDAGVTSVPSGYAGLYKLPTGELLAASTDGVGTKLKLAFQLKKHGTVGIDLVAMSVNDLICVGAKPLMFLDYIATGKLDLKVSTQVIQGIVEGCKQAGAALVGGETAEMPSMYAAGEYDLAGFAVGMVGKEDLITGKNIKSGDVLIGLESSGPHSNGFSLIRKLLKPKDKALLAEAFVPTKIYVKPFLELRREIGAALKGAAHITGSGFLNIPRMNEKFDYEIQFPSYFEMPRIFNELKKRGRLSWAEMFTTFNMGIGMVVAVESVLANRVGPILARKGVKAHRLGVVRPAKKAGKSQVSISFHKEFVQLDY